MAGLQDRTIVVTGGARGIGLAICEAARAGGARVAVVDIDGSAAAGTATRLGPRCRGYALDVCDAAGFAELLESVEHDLGPVDVLINNAGIAEASARIGEQSRKMIDRTIDVNLRGTINGTLCALARMERRGSGQIVNIASQAGRLGVPALAAYTASKFGVVGFTDAVRFEYRKSGVCFTCVMPGPARTQMMDGTRRVPLVRLVTPQAIAAEVIAAIEHRREEVFVPRSSGYLVRFSGLLSPRWRERLIRFFGLEKVYSQTDPVTRAGYVDRVERQASMR
jgi:NAD(P)-dependent dehydrogenase (short-subunit alcohol dehydrogenase family)